MATAGLYRRILPCPPAVDFASSQGKVSLTHEKSEHAHFFITIVSLLNFSLFIEFQELFLEAIHNGTMEGFYKLVSHFQTQSEPAFCGLASLSMVLNALAIDPGRKWKGTLYAFITNYPIKFIGQNSLNAFGIYIALYKSDNSLTYT